MTFQNFEPENFGLMTVEPPAYKADMVVTDTAFMWKSGMIVNKRSSGVKLNQRLICPALAIRFP